MSLTGLPLALQAQSVLDSVKTHLTDQTTQQVEQHLNTKANQWLNHFGEGHSRLVIEDIETQKVRYSLDSIQPLESLEPNMAQLNYVQGSLFSAYHQGERRSTVNLGIGQRHLLEAGQSIASHEV